MKEQDLADNNPIPPRPRSHFGADSPRRGEYGALGRRLRRGQQFCAGEIGANK